MAPAGSGGFCGFSRAAADCGGAATRHRRSATRPSAADSADYEFDATMLKPQYPIRNATVAPYTDHTDNCTHTDMAGAPLKRARTPPAMANATAETSATAATIKNARHTCNTRVTGFPQRRGTAGGARKECAMASARSGS